MCNVFIYRTVKHLFLGFCNILLQFNFITLVVTFVGNSTMPFNYFLSPNSQCVRADILTYIDVQ